jgi:hypothetical protein
MSEPTPSDSDPATAPQSTEHSAAPHAEPAGDASDSPTLQPSGQDPIACSTPAGQADEEFLDEAGDWDEGEGVEAAEEGTAPGGESRARRQRGSVSRWARRRQQAQANSRSFRSVANPRPCKKSKAQPTPPR